jgi:hypothetical protein
MINGNLALINGGLSAKAIVRARFPMARMPDGAPNQVLVAQGVGVDPAYTDSPTLTQVTASEITVTGPLTIVRDTTSKTDGFIVLKRASSAGLFYPIVAQLEDGTIKAVIRMDYTGNMALSPGYQYYAAWSDLIPNPDFNTPEMRWSMPLRRMMLINSLIFS